MASYLFVVVVFSLDISDINIIGMTVSHIGQNLAEVPERTSMKSDDVSSRFLILGLSKNNISNIFRGAFRKYTSMRHLYLNRNTLTNVSSYAFDQTIISVLCLNVNELSCIPDLSPLKMTLRVLNISNNRLHNCAKGYLYSAKFRQLSIISLRYNKLTHLAAMTILWNAPTLTRL